MQIAHVKGKIAVIIALPARHDVKSEMQKEEKGKLVQSNSSLAFSVCILQLSNPDMKTVCLYHCLKACPSFIFSTLFPSFPRSCFLLLCTEPQGTRGRSRVTWASSWECHLCSITHPKQVLQSLCSMRPSPGDGHSCTPVRGRQSMAEAWCPLPTPWAWLYTHHPWRSATPP